MLRFVSRQTTTSSQYLKTQKIATPTFLSVFCIEYKNPTINRLQFQKNMKNTLLQLLLLFTIFTAHAQAPAIQWQKCYGGTGDEAANCIIQTTDGGYIAAGYTNAANGDVTGVHGGYDYWVVKINPAGTIEWQKAYGGSFDDQAASIRQTTDGGYIVAGYSESNNGDITNTHGLLVSSHLVRTMTREEILLKLWKVS